MKNSKDYADVVAFLIFIFVAGMLLGFILGQGLTMKSTFPINENTVQIYGKNYFYE